MQSNNSCSQNKESYSPYLTGVIKFILSYSIIILFTIPFIITAATSNQVAALTYRDTVNLQFTWNPAINISLSSADLVISNLTPGTSADSNVITINVGTNNSYGYILSATVGNATNASTNLVNTTDNTKLFTSLATTDSLATLTTDNTWGYSFSTDSGTNWSNCSGLPLYTDPTGVELINNNSTGSTPIEFKIAAKASAEQASGTYINTINFTAVANPEPTPEPISCTSRKICYSPNALDAEGNMGEQTATNNSSITLLASNYSRHGYGFAGWSPTMDGSGIIYGPNETITVGDLSEGGLALYAVWIPSAGNLQNWSGCSNLTQGSVTALTDSRDNNTYAVARLADGKCWMIENLRLDNTTTDNSNGSLAQGYGGQFAGLANPENPWLNTATEANSIYYSGTQEGTASVDVGTTNAVYLFPRYNNQNIASRADTITTNNNNIYSYGNYYTWAATIADTTNYNTNNYSVGSTSICPAGWRLPRGGNKSNEANNELWALFVTGLNNGVKPANYDSSAQPYYNGGAEASSLSNTIRSYPINMLYSGEIYGGEVNSRGSLSSCWTATTIGNDRAYYSRIGNTNVYPGNGYGSKFYGRTIRCLTNP